MREAEVLFQHLWTKLLHRLNDWSIHLIEVLDVKTLKKMLVVILC